MHVCLFMYAVDSSHDVQLTDVNLDTIKIKLVPNGTNPGPFQIGFQYILAHRQNVLKSDLKKSRICPISGQSDPLLAQI